ncbi:MAG: hypothetical protein KDE09_25050 [Anaerolineales bacterium]|nr:hypothetical protein [Anaerolineales bacterium]MCB0021098.1 hypothetical protein [Anaerolineales bacterium]
MCNEIRYLAELDHFRFLAICEHEMLHLGWDHAIFYLSPDAFNSLREMLAEIDLTGQDIAGAGGIYWLHLYDFALQLSPRDLEDLARLVQEATTALPPGLGTGLLDTELELIWETTAPEDGLLTVPFSELSEDLFSLN